MEQLIIYARQENKLKDLAKKHKCNIVVNRRFNVYTSDLTYASEYENGNPSTTQSLQKSFNRQAEFISNQVLFEAIDITIEANQEGNQVKLLGMVDEDGYVTTISEDIKWNDFDTENIDMLRCDRCKTKHRRKKVFIVEGLTGDYANKVMQVGGSCASKLDCEKTLKKLLKQVQWFIDDLEKFEDDLVYSWGKSDGYAVIDSLEELFQVSASYIKKNGYVSYAEADNPYENKKPTGRIISQLFDSETTNQKTQSLINQLSAEERTENYWTKKVLSWLENQEDSDYIHNSKVAIAKLDVKKRGVLISLVWMVIKHDLKVKEKELRNEFADELVKPIEGAKIAIEALVLGAKTYDDHYGTRKGLTVLDRKYGKIFFKTTSEWVWNVKVSDVIKGKITVKIVTEDISFAKTSSRKFEVINS